MSINCGSLHKIRRNSAECEFEPEARARVAPDARLDTQSATGERDNMLG